VFFVLIGKKALTQKRVAADKICKTADKTGETADEICISAVIRINPPIIQNADKHGAIQVF
jgi:hypothetical protein